MFAVVARRAREAGVVIDAVFIGDEENDHLLGSVAATGGLAFRPSTLNDALRLCEVVFVYFFICAILSLFVYCSRIF